VYCVRQTFRYCSCRCWSCSIKRNIPFVGHHLDDMMIVDVTLVGLVNHCFLFIYFFGGRGVVANSMILI